MGGCSQKEVLLVLFLRFVHSSSNEICFFHKTANFLKVDKSKSQLTWSTMGWKPTRFGSINCLLGGCENADLKATSVVWAPQSVGWKIYGMGSMYGTICLHLAKIYGKCR